MRGAGRQHGGAAGGFTLLELAVVMMLLAVLFGIGVGFLQRDTKARDLALAAVRDALRVARDSAVSRNAPAAVVITPGGDTALTTVRARVLEPVGIWPLEDREAPLSRVLGAQLTGTPVPAGRFGACRRPDPDATLLIVPAARTAGSLFDLRDGYAFRVDLRLDDSRACTVAVYGRAMSLRLDGELFPEAVMTLAAAGEQPGALVRVRGPMPLPLHRWVNLAVVHDGVMLRLVVDGDEVAADRARGRPYVGTEPAPFEVSPRDAVVPGLVDSIELFAYRVEDPRTLPDTVRLTDIDEPIRFDGDGSLVAEVGFTLVEGEERVPLRVVAGGILQ